jgi:hypothetical protein
MKDLNSGSRKPKHERRNPGDRRTGSFRAPRSPFRVGVCALLSAFCLTSVLCPPSSAQSYSLDWAKIAGGGGTSTNGQLAVSGTIGQPDAGGPMTNGQYAVTGGFWALPTAIQVEGAPTLTIAKGAPGFALISWTPATGTNWVLQERLSLTAGAWTNSVSGSTNPIVIPAIVPTKYYRLFRP